MKYGIAILILLAVSFWAFSEEIGLPNLQKPKFNVYTSGQPSVEGFHQASAMGIKTVINVLPEKECMIGEEQVVADEDMVYHSVPFDTKMFKMETVKAFAKVLENEDGPVLIHCTTGNHAGGLWFAYRVLIDKAPLGVALKEARRIGLKQELEDPLFNWVVNQQELMLGGVETGS